MNHNDLGKPRLKIFVNGRFLTQQLSGVQAFARGICAELLGALPETGILVPAKAPLKDPAFAGNIIRTGNFTGNLWEQLELPRFMNKHPDAILLNLCNSAPLLLKKQAVTIHDLAVFKQPGWFSRPFGLWYRFLIPRITAGSKHIFTVSETVKLELIKQFALSTLQITVITNKAGAELLSSDPIPPVVPQIDPGNFFLMVGTSDPRKNFDVAIRLFASGLMPHQLVIAGGDNRNFAKSINSAYAGVIRTGFTGYGELRWLYENAIALINPSHYEGFGIPNIEAMALNCPVLCSNIPVFREICRDAAIYFNQNNPDSLREAITSLLENKGLRERYTSAGKSIFTGLQNQNRSQKIINALFQ